MTSLSEQFEKVALDTIKDRHPEFIWIVCLLDYGRRIAVGCIVNDKSKKAIEGKQIIGPRDDYLEIADALADELTKYAMSPDQIESEQAGRHQERSRKRLNLKRSPNAKA